MTSYPRYFRKRIVRIIIRSDPTLIRSDCSRLCLYTYLYGAAQGQEQGMKVLVKNNQSLNASVGAIALDSTDINKSSCDVLVVPRVWVDSCSDQCAVAGEVVIGETAIKR